MSKLTARQFLVSVKGIDGLFANKTGGNVTSDANKVYDGGNPVPDIVTGVPVVDNLTVSRPYDSARDSDMVRRLRSQVGRFRTTLSVQECDEDYVAIGTPHTYTNAVLTSVNEPEANASSADGAVVELVFAVASVV